MPASARSDPPSDAAHSPMRPGASADSCRFCRKKVRRLGSSCVRPKPQRTPIGGHHSWRRRGARSSRGPRSGLEERQRRRRCHGRSATRFRPMAGAPACRRDERLLVMDACRRELPARTPSCPSDRPRASRRETDPEKRAPPGAAPVPSRTHATSRATRKSTDRSEDRSASACKRWDETRRVEIRRVPNQRLSPARRHRDRRGRPTCRRAGCRRSSVRSPA